MGRLRDYARDVTERGSAARSDFQPKPGSVPVRMYTYWAQRALDPPKRENFCHYWRVVIFWAPLFFAGNVALRFLESVIVRLVLIALAVSGLVVGIMLSGGFGWFVLCVLAACVVCVAFAAVSLFIAHVFNKLWNPVWNKIAAWMMLSFVVSFFVFVGYVVSWWILIGVTTFIGLVFALVFYLETREHHLYTETDDLEHTGANGTHGDAPSREPGRISKFFTGFGELLILVAQVIRVSKWKICPTVTIDVGDK